jgi:TolB-like protein/Tfp pilus assembly protein PilF
MGRATSHGAVRFGVFEFDADGGELRKDGYKVRLQEQPLQILQILLEHPGNVISRDELQKRVWPSDTFVDFDHGINNAIKRLREALGDTAEAPRYIETLPRRGYRFIESVARVPESSPSIAVLPFLNLSADPENEYFADGMSEEIINALMQIRHLKVAARTSSFSFKGKQVDLAVIRERLNVESVLEGSVRRSGNHVRITAQLVNTSDGYHLWSEKYDREMKDIFEVQDEIARTIVRRLEVTLEGEQPSFAKAGTDNLDAFKLYMQGRLLFFQRGIHLPGALDCFRQAVDRDPQYAAAWASLADAYNLIGFYGLANPQECLPKGREAALRAVALADSMSETHASLALSLLYLDWDRTGAQREFSQALELNPRNGQARSWYGLFCLEWLLGRFEEGICQGRQAAELDPLSGYAKGILACMCIQGDLDEAISVANAALQLEPQSFLARWALLTAFNSQGRFEEAAAVGEQALKVSGRYPWMLASLARTYSKWGRPRDSEALYMELRWRSKRDYISPVVLAWAAAAAGDQEAASQYAQEGHEIGDPTLVGGRYWPDFERLREDSRFRQILKCRGWE